MASVRYSLIVYSFLLLSLHTYAQIKKHKADATYPNGQLKFEGKYIKCKENNPQYPRAIDHQNRKIGKWTAYNPDGSLKEIRHYTERVKNCHTKIDKQGEWEYFNNEGVHYLSEKYKDDILLYSEVEIYERGNLIGKLIVTDSSTSYHVPNVSSSNLVSNPSFDQYYYEPAIVYDGKNPAEKMVPFWYSPDQATPDYYNTNKTVARIPKHFDNHEESANMDGYVGLILFRGPKKIQQGNLMSGSDPSIARTWAEDYSESIQTQLVKPLDTNKLYCFEVSIRLSINAGYAIDRFGATLSETELKFGYLNAPKNSSVAFSKMLDNTKEWQKLCSAYRAKGGESFLTLGRFSALDQTKSIAQIPEEISSLDVNRSAYYLFNELSIVEIESPDECQCNSINEVPMSPSIAQSTNTFEVGKPFVIDNLEFDTNDASIKDSFIPELQRLLSYLFAHESQSLSIAGYTDNVGRIDYNLQLSVQRAKAIGDWLNVNGIESSRIKTEGFGNSKPIVKNTTSENRMLNRRVEFELSIR